MMTDIFLSYAREDKERAKKIAKMFELQGWSVWWDVRIPTGKKYRNVITENLLKSKCVVVLWSNTSVNKDWVIDEAREGKSLDKLFPIFIDNGDLKAPMGLREVQAIFLDKWDGTETFPAFQDLISDLKKYILTSKNEPVKEKSIKPSIREKNINLFEESVKFDPKFVFSGWVTFIPYSLIKIMWKKKDGVFGYNMSDMLGEPHIIKCNPNFLELFDIPALEKENEDFDYKVLTYANLTARIQPYINPEDLKLFSEDQERLTEKIIFRGSIDQAKVPLRFNQKHPIFPNKSFWPVLLGMQILGDVKNTHSMFLTVAYFSDPCERND